MSRNYDRHPVTVTYRTAKMADADADRLRRCGWLVRQGGAGSTQLEVETYKPESLFGPLDTKTTSRPDADARYSERDRWRHGIVGWEFACDCTVDRLRTDYRPAGILTTLQPVGQDGKIFLPASEYIIDHVDWPCTHCDERARVGVRLPKDEGWRGRVVCVPESVVHALLPGVSSADRQHYIETGTIAPHEEEVNSHV